MTAPVTMTITMQLIRVVSAIELMNPFHVSCLLMIAINKVTKAPAAAASVGVKIPKNMPPMTRAKMIRVSITPANDLAFSFKLVLGPGGAREGFLITRK